jgi:hypothetical protein
MNLIASDEAKILALETCMFDALIEYALCGSRPRDESK